MYKIKQVTSSEGNFVVNEKSSDPLDEDEEVKAKSRSSSSRYNKKGGVNVGIDDFDSDEDNQSLKSKSKKNKAVFDYKSAINSIGSKVATTTTGSLGGCVGKRNPEKVIITESEKDASDDWLINDMVRTNTSGNNQSNVNNKRKSHHVTETDSEDEAAAPGNKQIDDDLANLSFNDMDLDESGALKSPISKKRLIDSSDESQKGGFAGICQMDDSSTDMPQILDNYGYDPGNYAKMGNELRKMNGK